MNILLPTFSGKTEILSVENVKNVISKILLMMSV